MLSTKKAKIFTDTVLFIVYLVIGMFIIYQIEDGKRTYYLETQSKLLKDRYDTQLRYARIMSSDIYEMYRNKPQLIAFLNAANHESPDKQRITRKKLYNLLKRNYKRLENMGISQVQFLLPNNHSFLRMHTPDDFGDDLSQIRKSIALTNKTKITHEGMEMGKTFLAYRFVYPLFNKNKKHIGSVEIAFSTRFIVKNIVTDFTYDRHILISKQATKKSLINTQYGESYKDTWETKNYYIEELTHSSIRDKNLYKHLNTPKLKKILDTKIQTQKPFALSVDYNYKEIVLNFLPISSADNIPNIAYLVTYTVSDYLGHIKIQSRYIQLFFISLSFLIYLFTIYIILNREKLKELALYDTLTNLPNRTLFNIEVEHELILAKRYNYKLALMFLDLDEFKAVNDTYGHHIGDLLLKEVGKKINHAIRKVDIASRLSGDEFAVVLSHIEDTQQAIKIAQNILQELTKEIILQNNRVTIGVSIGIAIYPDDASDIQTLLVYADKTMYKAKRNGKNQIYIYNNKEKNNV